MSAGQILRDAGVSRVSGMNEEDKCLESLLKPTKCVCGEPSDTNVVHRSDAPCYYKSQPAQQDPRNEALEDAKQFEAVVVASDHPARVVRIYKLKGAHDA